MNRGYYIGVATLVALGVAASIVLKPQEKEVAFMRMKDNHMDEALQLYEKKYADGDRSVNIVMPLANVYLEKGMVENAVAIMEDFVNSHPDILEARQRLGELYDFSQEPDKVMANLEVINRLQPDPANLRRLEEYYSNKNNLEKQQETLEQLASSSELTEQERIQLSYFYALHKDFDKAVAVFDGITDSTIRTFQPYTVKYMASLLLDEGHADKAIAVVQHYVEGKKSYQDLVPILAMMYRKGNIPEGLALMQPYQGLMLDHPALLEEFASLELANGNTDSSFGMLQTLFQQHKLTDSLLDTFAEIALFRAEEDVLDNIVQHGTITALPEERLLGLAEFALQHERPDWMERLRQKLGVAFMEGHPATALAFALAEHKPAETPSALNIADLSPDITAMLVRMLVASGTDKTLAMQMMAAWEATMLSQETDFMEVASFYIKLGEAARGMHVLLSFKDKTSHRERVNLERGIALLEVGTGDNGKVLAWVNRAEAKDFPLVEYMYSISLEQKNKALALATAEKLYQWKKQPQTTLYLADALLLNGNTAEALAHLRPLYSTYKEAAPSYIQALLKSQKTSPEAVQEMSRFLQSNTFASLAVGQKRDIAYQLLENGQKLPAEDIFFILAEHALPASPDVEELFYLWGKDIPEKGMAWLQKRTNAAPSKDKLIWLAYFQQADKYEEIITAIQSRPFPLETSALELYLNALYQTKRWDALDAVLEKQTAGTMDTKMQRVLVEYARASGQPRIMEKIYRILEKVKPDDVVMQREIALLAYSQGKYSLAEKRLEDYLKAHQDDYQAQYYYAELLNRNGERTKAAHHYEKVLKLMVALPQKDITLRITGAVVHYRLGEKDKAFAAFKQMLKEAPDNAEVRENYVNLLMDTGLYDEAESLLQKNQPF